MSIVGFHESAGGPQGETLVELTATALVPKGYGIGEELVKPEDIQHLKVLFEGETKAAFLRYLRALSDWFVVGAGECDDKTLMANAVGHANAYLALHNAVERASVIWTGKE